MDGRGLLSGNLHHHDRPFIRRQCLRLRADETTYSIAIQYLVIVLSSRALKRSSSTHTKFIITVEVRGDLAAHEKN